MSLTHKPDLSNVSDEEWSMVVPSLALMDESAPQRHILFVNCSTAFATLCVAALHGGTLNDLPPWSVVYQQSQHCLAAGVFAAFAKDLRAVLQVAAGRSAEPIAATIDTLILRFFPKYPRNDYACRTLMKARPVSAVKRALCKRQKCPCCFEDRIGLRRLLHVCCKA